MRAYKTENYTETTKQEFQQYKDEPLTETEAHEIQNNLFGVVNLLLKWGNEFVIEGLRILQRLRQLINAKDKHAELDLILNNEEESIEYKMRKRFPFFK